VLRIPFEVYVHPFPVVHILYELSDIVKARRICNSTYVCFYNYAVSSYNFTATNDMWPITAHSNHLCSLPRLKISLIPSTEKIHVLTVFLILDIAVQKVIRTIS
jgi:hypothetical protein